jgi:hypothetical protein
MAALAKFKPAPSHERKSLFGCVWMHPTEGQKTTYLHAKDIGDAKFQLIMSRGFFPKGALIIDTAQAIGHLGEEEEKVIRVFGGL